MCSAAESWPDEATQTKSNVFTCGGARRSTSGTRKSGRLGKEGTKSSEMGKEGMKSSEMGKEGTKSSEMGKEGTKSSGMGKEGA